MLAPGYTSEDTHIRKEYTMCDVKVRQGIAWVFSWTTGFVRKPDPSLLEEWKANAEAVLERYSKLGLLDELEALMDRGLLR